MHDVFISYSSKDWEYVYQLRAHLLNSGLSCWMAPDSIPAGSNYTREIPIGIRDCQVFLLVLSNHSVHSQWVLKELDTAINKKKLVIPFVLENCTLTDEFEFLLAGCQSKFAQSPNALFHLANQIRVSTGKNPIPSAPVAPPPVAQPAHHIPSHQIPAHRPVPPPKKRKPWGLLIGIILAVMVLVGAGILSEQKAATQKKETSYQMAESLLRDQDYAGAIEVFRNLNGYKDSDTRAMQLEQDQLDYDIALQLLENGQFDEATQAFQMLGNYRDSAEYAVHIVPYREADYRKACAMEADEAEAVALYEQAAGLYQSLDGYEDSAHQAGQCLLKAAQILLSNENYDQALAYLDQLSEADANTLRNMYVETCADGLFLIDLEDALLIWLDASDTYSLAEEIDLAWAHVEPYQQAHFHNPQMVMLLEDFRTALERIKGSLANDATIQNYPDFYLGIHQLCLLAETLQQDYQILTSNTDAQQFFIGTANYYYALYTLETSFDAWWASDSSDCRQYASGGYYTIYTNDTDYSFDLIATIKFFDSNSVLQETQTITLPVAKGGTVSIPLKPETISSEENFQWRIIWEFENIA